MTDGYTSRSQSQSFRYTQGGLRLVTPPPVRYYYPINEEGEEEEEEIDYGSSTEEDGPTPRVRSPQVLSRAGSVVVSLAHTSSFT